MWQQIAEDVTLPVDAREKAGEALNELRVARTGGDPEVAAAEEQRRRERERQARAEELVDQARRARDEGHYELAFQTCQDALEWDPKNDEAAALLTEIREAMPDRAQLLRTLMKFANTTRVQAFLRLKSQFEKLERSGRNQFKAEDYARADETFREAVALIDGSEFFVDLKDERTHAVQWLRQTIEKAAEKGIRLAAVPPLPDPAAVAPSFRRRFYDLLSEVFTARPGEEDPLVLYAMLPPGRSTRLRRAGPRDAWLPEGHRRTPFRGRDRARRLGGTMDPRAHRHRLVHGVGRRTDRPARRASWIASATC